MADGLAPMRLCPSVPDMAQLVWHQKTTMTPRESFVFPKKLQFYEVFTAGTSKQ